LISFSSFLAASGFRPLPARKEVKGWFEAEPVADQSSFPRDKPRGVRLGSLPTSDSGEFGHIAE
jgi:hypothetical protein